MARPLNTPITDDGLTSIRFFNGRVLSAADLETEQAANRRRRAQVGRAQGTGTVHGLRVRPAPGDAPTALRVTKGLAINRAGNPVELFVDVEVSVVDADIDPEPATGGDFVVCEALPSVTATGTGAYLLVACPAVKRREQAPGVAMGDGGMAGSCGPKYQVEGVRFRLVHLDTSDDRLVSERLREPLRALMGRTGLSAPERSRRRNLLAHWCLGTADTWQMPVDLYDRLGHETRTYGPLDALRMPTNPDAVPPLTARDVPLAIFIWEDDRVTMVDEWAVRRRVHRLAGAPEPVADRRRAEGEAAFRQFQAHVADLTAPGGATELLPILEARIFFDILPAAGIVPVEPVGPHEENLDFVNGLTHREAVYVEGAEVARLLDRSFLTPAHRIASGEMLALYRVRQNRQSEEATAYMVFASGYLPPLGHARYDLARWSYSNYPSPFI